MKKILVFCLLLLSSVSFAFAQQNQPFAALDEQIKAQANGWNGSKENLSKIFQAARKTLGERFEAELWKYLGADAEKHRWSAAFLDSESYLHGSEALPDLALKIRENGLKLLREKTDESSNGNRFSLAVSAAVAAEKGGKRNLAANYKAEASSLAVSGLDVSVYFPVLSRYERCLYQNIGQSSSPCEPDEMTAQREISMGVVNSRALILPKPLYPKELKKQKISGEVWIKVTINEQGNVTSAEAVKGPAELHQTAVDAALGAKFTPTLLQGNFVKVTGTIVYKFVP